MLALPRLAALPVAIAVTLSASAAFAYANDHLLNRDDIGINKIPNAGTSHILVVPVRVGEESYPAAELAELEAIYDASGGSFRAYWQVMSGGRYDPIPTLVEPVLYPDSCPVPGKSVANCTIGFEDAQLIAEGGLKAILAGVLGRIRDEQGVDLSHFDVNGAAGEPDGYFDGVVFHTDIVDGVAPPLAELFNETVVEVTPGGATLSLGIVSMAPPIQHEFAHNFGFIDLYGGPPVNCLMDDSSQPLGAFSRQQIGWADVRDVAFTQTVVLPAVLTEQVILRVGQAPRYVLIDNRGGALHGEFDHSAPGVYVSSIDETTVIQKPLGFLLDDLSDIYLPNAEPPYLDVALPVGCSVTGGENACAIAPGQERRLQHADGTDMGFTLRVVGGPDANGAVTIELDNGTPPPGAELPTGCAVASHDDDGVRFWYLAALLALWGAGRARRAQAGTKNGPVTS